VAGVGKELNWTVTIGGQASGLSITSSAYIPPAISGLSGDATAIGGSTTTGGTNITIDGDNFGPEHGETVGELEVTYGPDGTEYRATDCVVTGQQQIACKTQPGVGKDLKWKVSIGNQDSGVFESETTRYANPTVDSITTGPFNTGGNQPIVINGTNFGVASDPLTIPAAFFGSGTGTYSDALVSCTVTIDHVQMSCMTAAGSGKDYQVQVNISGQLSAASSGTPFRYSAPVIDVVSVDGAESVMRTNGASKISITGSNFGPECTGCVNAAYSSGANS
jgi:predicted small secreted protein